MAGNEGARNNLGVLEGDFGNMDEAFEDCGISGEHGTMHQLTMLFEKCKVSRESIDQLWQLTLILVPR
jgi:hypothetical protein